MRLLPRRPRALTAGDLAVIEDQRLRRLAEYWLAKRGERLIARRADIDPTEMKWILPHVWLHDIEPGTGRLRCRLAGEEVRAMYAVNIVGKYLDEYVLATNWHKIERHYRAVIEGPAIGYTKGQVYRAALDQHGLGERIQLPLCDEEGARVTVLLGATVYRTLPTARDPGAVLDGDERALIPLAAAPDAQA